MSRDEGKYLARILWPELFLTADGDNEDIIGIDAYFHSKPVQIKYDSRIGISHNIYHEIYEKSVNKPHQEWRHSPQNASLYIFLTKTDKLLIGHLIPVDILANCEKGQTLHLISPNKGHETSMGFIIPILKLPSHEIKSEVLRG